MPGLIARLLRRFEGDSFAHQHSPRMIVREVEASTGNEALDNPSVPAFDRSQEFAGVWWLPTMREADPLPIPNWWRVTVIYDKQVGEQCLTCPRS